MIALCPLLMLAAAPSPVAWFSEPEAPAPLFQTTSSAASRFSYRYAELNFVNVDVDGASDDARGFNVGGSFDLAENFFVVGSIQRLTIDESGGDSDFDTIRVGVGFHTPISDSADFVADASFLHVRVDTPSGDDSEDGFSIRAGARLWVAERFELNGAIEYIDVIDNDTGVHLGARYYITDPLSVGLELTHFDDTDEIALGLRYSF